MAPSSSASSATVVSGGSSTRAKASAAAQATGADVVRAAGLPQALEAAAR